MRLLRARDFHFHPRTDFVKIQTARVRGTPDEGFGAEPVRVSGGSLRARG